MALLDRLTGPLARPFAGLRRWAAARPLSTPALVEFCRSIRFFLVSGMTLRDGMRSLAEKGTAGVRGAAAAIADELSSGWSLEDALAKQGERFPPLFRSLAVVGEETGKLPEVMADLERYYEHHQKQQRQLVGQAMKPLIQYVLAVLVVSGLILFLSFLPSTKSSGGVRKQAVEVAAEGGGTKTVEAYLPVAYDPLGLGLTGERGAVQFLLVGFATPLLLWLAYRLVRWALRGRAVVDRVVLHLPFVGGAARALALTRFSFAMHLMLDSSMSILKTIRLAFPATSNGAFALAGLPAEAVLRRGNPVVTALEDTRLFPPAYLSAAAVGEQTGHLPEVMEQQAAYHAESAERRVATLYAILGYLVWIAVAVFIAFLVVRLFSNYVDQIDNAQRT